MSKSRILIFTKRHLFSRESRLLLFAILLLPTWASMHVLRAAETTPPQPFGDTDLQSDPAMAFGKLANDLIYVVMPNREPRGRVSLRLLVEAGSLNERDDQRGLAHYLEHMAFKGTENFEAGTLVEYFQNLGMSFGPDANAYTGFDRTVYQIELPDQDSESIGDALKVLRDFADRMIIAESEVESERGVILSEKRTRDSIGFRTALAEYDFLLPDAILADRFPIGVEPVLRAVDSQALREFYEDWYQPLFTRIIVVGDVEPDTVRPLIAGHFDGFQAKAPSPTVPDPGRVTPRELDIGFHPEPEAPATRVSIQTVYPYQARPDTLERRHDRLIRTAALQMLTRRLDRLARQPDAPFVRGMATAYDLFDFVTNPSVDLITQSEKWEDALTVAEQELRRALLHGFHDYELQEVRANLINAFEENARRAPTRLSRNLAESLVGSLVTGRVMMQPSHELELMRPALEALDVAQCLSALQAIFPEDQRLVFVTGNLAIDDPETSIREVYQAAAAVEVEPLPHQDEIQFGYMLPEAPGEVAERRHVTDLDIHQIRFNNQILLNLKHTDFSSNQVLIAVRIGSGQLAEPIDQSGLADLSSEVLIPGGLGKHSDDDLRRIFAGRNVNWSFNVGPDAFVFNGATTPGDLTAQLNLLTAYLTDPGLRDEALRRARDMYDEAAIAARHTAGGMLQNTVSRFLAGGDKRFGLADRADFMARDLDDVRRWLVPALLKDRLEISIVGDIGDIEASIEAVGSTLGALPERRSEKADYSELRKLSRPAAGTDQRFDFESRIPGGYSIVYWPIPDMWDIQRTRRLSILARVFSDRMRLRIRESMGEAYSAQAISHPSETYIDYGWFYGLVPVDPAAAELVAREIVDIAADLHGGEISEDEHQRALRPMLASLRDALRENRYWLNSVMISAWEHPQRLEWARAMTEDFNAITVDDLARLAKQYLAPAQRIKVYVIPVAPTDR